MKEKFVFFPLGVISFFFLLVWLALDTDYLYFFSRQKNIDPQKLTATFDRKAKEAIFCNKTVSMPSFVAEGKVNTQVLGESAGPKRIEVDLSNQRLYAYEGDRLIYNFLISSGKWGRTPTGTFQIWGKFRYTKMEGGSRAIRTYYYLPNVPYVMFFYNDEVAKSRGYSLHGTYWHNNFGHPMSHGCVNMKTEEAGLIYYWSQPDLKGKQSLQASADNPGTPITIYGTAPKE